MYEAGLVVFRKSQRYVPVKTNKLRQSGFVETRRGFGGAIGALLNLGGQWNVVIGYTAAYAALVHEIDKSYRRPGSSWKFLAKALNESHAEVLETIRRNAEV